MKIIMKILLFFFPNLFNQTKTNEIQNIKYYSSKSFMTEMEKKFYQKLIEIEHRGNYKIIPQVNLAAIINKESNERYQSELYRNIDFGVFDNDFNLLLLIELNDDTHRQPSRIKRDKKVREICNMANIKILNFGTKYPNEQEYVINRIINTINENSVYEPNRVE